MHFHILPPHVVRFFFSLYGYRTDDWHTVFPRRSLVGMRSIIHRLDQKALEEDEDVVHLAETDAMAIELLGERIRALTILDKVMDYFGVEDAYAEMRKGSWRDPGPEVDLSDLDLS